MADQCQAINAGGASAGTMACEGHRQGERCSDPALPRKPLCWVHQATVDLGLGTVAEVLRGERRAPQARR